MPESFADCAVAAAILLVAWLATHLFTRWAYKRCLACGALNAHRRERCRICQSPFDRSELPGTGPRE